MEKLIIIGGGCAGYTAGIYAGRAGLEPVLFEGLIRGGQLSTTTDVENYPGFSDGVQGPLLMEQMRAQAERCGTKIITDVVNNVKRRNTTGFIVDTDSGGTLESHAVIVATGATAKWLGLESEEKYKNKGVSACATCDGFFYKGKDVVVIGGGNVAVEESIFLSNIVNSVTLVHRRDTLRAEKTTQQRLFRNKKINIIWNHVAEEIIGTDKNVTGVVLRSVSDNTKQTIATNGVFVAIGHEPNSAVVKELVRLKQGYIVTEPGSTKTDTPGLFAAGDVSDPRYRQAVTAAGSGCMAAIDTEKYLSTLFE